MNESHHCPACGATLPQSATEGLCPACLMAQAMRPTGDLPPTPAPDLETVRAAFPHLEILALIGHGGMGAVFKARQPQLDRAVALKLLAPAHTDDAWFAARFQREARALAALNHPNIVTIHDFGQAAGFYFLLMEFVDGVNLRQALDAGHLAPQQALAIVPQLCDALQFAHDRGIVHRDIKSRNLLIDAAGDPWLIDFGLCKMDTWSELPDGTEALKEFDAQDTWHGALAGTAAYLAPERWLGKPYDRRADIFSLGASLFHVLTGEAPFGIETSPDLRRRILNGQWDDAAFRAAFVPPDVRRIVERCLAPDPDHRYPTAAALRDDLLRAAEAPAPGAAPADFLPAPPVGNGVDSSRIVRFGSIFALLLVVLLFLVFLPFAAVRGLRAVSERRQPPPAGLVLIGPPDDSLIGRRVRVNGIVTAARRFPAGSWAVLQLNRNRSVGLWIERPDAPDLPASARVEASGELRKDPQADPHHFVYVTDLDDVKVDKQAKHKQP